MKIDLKPGRYVVAVSGGVDSVVLLHLLAQKHDGEMVNRNLELVEKQTNFQLPIPNYQFIVAHFDHGIRADSAADRQFVQKLAAKYDLLFAFEAGKLGAKTSEAKARAARYQFLEKVRKSNKAKAIITAHHQDDLLETAILNILRGTGRSGLTSLKSRPQLIRPLLDFAKADIKAYANKHNLRWREDSTNTDTAYLRNYIRLKIIPKLPLANRRDLLTNIGELSRLNPRINSLIEQLLAEQLDRALNRQWFIGLPQEVALETMAAYLRQNELNVDRKTLNRLTIAAKTLPPGKRADINQKRWLSVKTKTIELI